MKVLVIPDVHLKPKLFSRAAQIMRSGIAERTICLMDLPDNKEKHNDTYLYEQTFDSAFSFASEFPQTGWCYGNHDLSYLLKMKQSGYSEPAANIVREKLHEFMNILPDNNPIRYVHRIDNTLFSHAGLHDFFVREYIETNFYDDVDAVIEAVNSIDPALMWNDSSPVWVRPQKASSSLYKATELLQVVGHSHVDEITRTGNLISCDVFSIGPDGNPVGEFLIVDTINWEYSKISM